MNKNIIILFLILIISLILFCNFVTVPLSGGSEKPGYIVLDNLRQLKPFANKLYDLVGIIIEPRKENLVLVINNFKKRLPSNAHIQVYHGTENKGLLNVIFKDDIESGKISLWNTGVDNLNIQSYSLIFTSKEFWDTVQAEKVLVFQTDAITCSESTVDLSMFYRYSFIGAPLPKYICLLIKLMFLCKGYYIPHSLFFNGGLSYRTKSSALKVIKEYPWDHKVPEDIWFCAFIPIVGGLLPEYDIAREFSYESEYLPDNNIIPWGLHKPRNNHNKLKQICKNAEKIPMIEPNSDYRNLYMI